MRSVRTTTRHGDPPVPVLATVYLVASCSGRRRLVALVGCPWCGHVHQHLAAVEFLILRRTAACGRGRYALHVGALEGAA